MSAPDMPREARKKLLLLEGQLHRLELLQARQACGSALQGGVAGTRLPGLLSTLLRQRAGSLLVSALPLLLRFGKAGRAGRRMLLLLGGGAAALGLLKGWLQREPADEPDNPADAQRAGKKNPGRSRD